MPVSVRQIGPNVTERTVDDLKILYHYRSDVAFRHGDRCVVCDGCMPTKNPDGTWRNEWEEYVDAWLAEQQPCKVETVDWLQYSREVCLLELSRESVIRTYAHAPFYQAIFNAHTTGQNSELGTLPDRTDISTLVYQALLPLHMQASQDITDDIARLRQELAERQKSKRDSQNSPPSNGTES